MFRKLIIRQAQEDGDELMDLSVNGLLASCD